MKEQMSITSTFPLILHSQVPHLSFQLLDYLLREFIDHYKEITSSMKGL